LLSIVQTTEIPYVGELILAFLMNEGKLVIVMSVNSGAELDKTTVVDGKIASNSSAIASKSDGFL